ncbi:MAG: DUF308 domain-containing protein [Bacteroidales bacterium]|nr:DUF308 domain-containing protein [Bacteroidales bacterium]
MRTHFDILTLKASRVIRHWWLYMLCGILCMVAGIAVFIFPMESYMTMGLLFGILMLFVGAAQLIVASSSGNYLAMKGYVIVGGILDLIMGIILCINPAVSLVLMPVLLGIWMLYHSFMIMAFGGDMETFRIDGSGWTIAGGALLMLLSIFVLVNPMSAGVATVVTLAGVGLIVFGLLLCVLSFKLKDLHRVLDDDI